MLVEYTRVWWKNHIVRRRRTYTEVTNSDGSRTDTPAPGEIFQQGTYLNETNLNQMDKGIADCAEAANDLEERKAEEFLFTATIPVSGWVGTAAPFTRQITVNGILASDRPIIDIVQSGTFTADSRICESWTGITRIPARNDGLTVTAEVVPEVAIPIQVRCFRHG